MIMNVEFDFVYILKRSSKKDATNQELENLQKIHLLGTVK